MIDPCFTEVLAEEVTRLTATFPDLAEGIERGAALAAEGGVFPDASGTQAQVRSQTDPLLWYPVNGSCTCKAATYYQGTPCAHRLAWRLYQVVTDRLTAEHAATEERWTVAEAPPLRDPAAQIPAQYVTKIQGKDFIRFEGLLALAHESGLVALETTMVQASPELAVCQSVATFRDGRRFTDVGDASPTNVAKHLAPHFMRMAATRASARALRRALNIGACSVEELGDEAAA